MTNIRNSHVLCSLTF